MSSDGVDLGNLCLCLSFDVVDLGNYGGVLCCGLDLCFWGKGYGGCYFVLYLWEDHC